MSFAHLEKQVTVRTAQVGLGLQCSDVSQVVTVRNSSCGKVMFYRCLSVQGGGVHPPAKQPNPGQNPPPPMATAADGTHTTGMHSCFFLFLPPATKLGQGYVFTRVCDSIHRGRGEGGWDGLPHCMLGYTPSPAQCMLGDMGNKRAVRILLECNLVTTCQRSFRDAMFSVCPMRRGCPM